MKQLAVQLVNDYETVSKEVSRAVNSSPTQLAQAVIIYVNSLTELTPTQVKHLLKFLTLPKLPPLVRVDSLRALHRGPAAGRYLASIPLTKLLMKEMPIQIARDKARDKQLREISYTGNIKTLPKFLTSKDIVVRQAAEKRFKYLESFPERKAALAAELECAIECKHKRDTPPLGITVHSYNDS